MYGHLQVLSTIFCEEISISSLVRRGRDLILQYMGGIGLMSGVLDALPGLGLLLLSVRGILHMGGARESVSTCKLSANRYDIYHCCVYSEKLLILDRGTV